MARDGRAYAGGLPRRDAARARETPRLTIGITTQNRPDALNACVRSLALLPDLVSRVLVFDDGSEPPATTLIKPDLRHGVSSSKIPGARIHRRPQSPVARRARAPCCCSTTNAFLSAPRSWPGARRADRDAARRRGGLCPGGSPTGARGRPACRPRRRLSLYRAELHRVRPARAAIGFSSSADTVNRSSTTGKRRSSACACSTRVNAPSTCRTPASSTPGAGRAKRRRATCGSSCGTTASTRSSTIPCAALVGASRALCALLPHALWMGCPRSLGLGLDRGRADACASAHDRRAAARVTEDVAGVAGPARYASSL